MDLLRPDDWSNFIGNVNNVSLIKDSLSSAIQRDAYMPHILLSGPPGVGKTTIANIIKNRLDETLPIHYHDTAGPLLDGVKSVEEMINDLATDDDITYNLIFADEIDIMDKRAEKTLLTILEGFRFKQQDIPKFTMIAACNDPGKLSGAFIRRFQLKLSMDTYTDADMLILIKSNTDKLNLKMPLDTVLFILSRSRNNPSFVNNILTTILDHKIAKDGVTHDRNVTQDEAEIVINRLGIGELGLLRDERIILDYLAYVGRPIGAKIICSACQLELDTYLNTYEPYLIRNRMIIITNKGRSLPE